MAGDAQELVHALIGFLQGQFVGVGHIAFCQSLLELLFCLFKCGYTRAQLL